MNDLHVLKYNTYYVGLSDYNVILIYYITI
jgi:hypothetical protein